MGEMPSKNAGPMVAMVCIAGPALVALVPMAAAPALVDMARHFGANADSQYFSQIVMTLPAAMLVFSAPLAGWLASRVGQRLVLLLSLVLFLIGGAGVLLVDSREALIALRLILGLAGGGLLTSCLGLIGDHFIGQQREKMLGYATAAASLLAGIALIFGGRLVDLGGWQAPFARYLLGLPVLIAAWFSIHNAPGQAKRVVHGAASLRELAKGWPYYLLLILLTLGMFTPAIQVGFVLSERGIGSAQTIGSIIAATAFVAMVSAWGFGWMRGWIGLHGVLVIDALSMGLGLLLIGFAYSSAEIFAGCCLIGIGAGMSEPAIASLLFHRLAPAVHALSMGFIVSALNIGQFINPIAFDPVRTVLGAPESFKAFGTLFMVIALIVFWRRPDDILERKKFNG